jgi:hypothetical protein
MVFDVTHDVYHSLPETATLKEESIQKLLAAAGGRNGSRAKIKMWRIADHHELCQIITAGEGFNALATFGADLCNSLRPKPRHELAMASASLLTLRVAKTNGL